jgi:hypothetical protein
MLVYGIKCGLADLVGLPKTTPADYYMDYGLLVFPGYSKATFLQNYGPQLNQRFFENLKRVVEDAGKVYEIDMEQPYISDEEGDLVKLLQETTPGVLPCWYHVPKIATPEMTPQLVVE